MHRMKNLLEQLQQLAPLAAAATAGPWASEILYDDEATVFFDKNGDGICPNPYQPICKADDLADDYAEPNAAFIAADAPR